MAASTKRLTRHEIMKEPDPFVEFVEKVVRYYREHRSRLIGIALGVIALALIAAVAVNYMASRELRANAALSEALEAHRRPVGDDVSDDASGGAKLTPFAEQDEKDKAVLSAADAVLAGHGGARSSRGALILKARLLANSGSYAEAAAMFGQVVGGSVPGDALGAAAFLSQASMRAAAGEVDAAIGELERVAGVANGYISRDVALEQAASIAETAGDQKQALVLYQRLVSETDDASVRSRSQGKSDELERDLEDTSGDQEAASVDSAN